MVPSTEVTSDRKRETLLFLTIVIPVFNVERYLGDCLRSVLEDTDDDIEIVAVDDGSTDSSAGILHTKSSEDSRLRVFGTEHRGLGAARNFGVSKARGDYVLFLDSDDWLAPGAIEILRRETRRSKTDVLAFDTRVRFEEKAPILERIARILYYRRRHGTRQICSGFHLLEVFARRGEWLPSACLFVTTQDLLVRQNIKFREQTLLEDHAFTYQVFSYARTARHLRIPLHRRRIRSGSITQDGNGVSLLAGYLRALEDILLVAQARNGLQHFSTGAIVNRMGCAAAMLLRKVPSELSHQVEELGEESPGIQKILKALSESSTNLSIALLRWAPGNFMAKRILRSLVSHLTT